MAMAFAGGTWLRKADDFFTGSVAGGMGLALENITL